MIFKFRFNFKEGTQISISFILTISTIILNFKDCNCLCLNIYMNYFRFSKLDQDLAPISAIKEEDEGEIESRRDLLTVNQKTDLKS